MPAPVFEERVVVLFVISVDPSLQRAGAERGVLAEHGLRYQVPAEGGGDLKGGDLAMVETVGKVPQRTLAARRLVDARHLPSVDGGHGEERSVPAPRQTATQLEVALGEDRQSAGGRCPFVRGHA